MPIHRRSQTTTLTEALIAAVGDTARVGARALDRHAAAHDASHFLLTPEVVVTARNAEEVGRLFAVSARHGVPLTLRSGGTSLSGQSVTDGILVDVRKGFRATHVLDGGVRIRTQPGVTVRQLNAELAPYGRKIGPDPASEVACTIGGVVADNSSGMACGTVENVYRTMDSMVVVLPSGTVVDTGAVDADARLRQLEPDLFDGLLRLRDRVRGNPASVAEVRRQFAMKNTMGYGLNALLDFHEPCQILAHLIVGSEGTLGFVAEVTLRTVPVRGHVSSALLVFDHLDSANRALPGLVASGAATIELMDARSLRVGQRLPDAPLEIATLDVNRQAALLIEYQSTASDELAALTAAARPVLSGLPLQSSSELSSDAATSGKLWKLRKGLYAAVAGAREPGTTALLEDVVVPVELLADTCAGLSELFDRYRYRDSVIFGHAKDGNIHFLLTDRFADEEPLRRYADFTEQMVDLVLAQGGSLKAEHGTGRVMAPYVRRQYGDELYDVMVGIKRLIDPVGLLNPGVLLDDVPDAHLRHIKVTPTVEEEVDRCVECGYCEPVCPSKDLTLTPRQRIVVRRAIAAAEVAGDRALADELSQSYEYAGVQTCAVDGMCGTACPVQINTGDLVRRLRREYHGRMADKGWALAARKWDGVTRVASAALTAALAVPAGLSATASRAGRAFGGPDAVPQWSPDLPGGGRRRSRPASNAEPAAVYLPACVNAMFGPADSGAGVQVGFETLCAAAGITLRVPTNVDSLCCGTPWSSKGMTTGYRTMRAATVPAVLTATRGGELPLICDASSCTEGLIKMLGAGAPQVKVIDAVSFVAQHVLPRLAEHPRLASLTVHPTCSSTQLGINDALLALAREVADEVAVPMGWGCCAFAGDRGMLHPELTASATAGQAAEVRERPTDAHASCNRTCEMAMTRATGSPYRHVIEVLADLVSIPPKSSSQGDDQ
ncbi:FAD-binding and (Fe-S)-binding domain-containing protein [Mycobacteroides abscessus]|uniref:FAD-binding and (Fe-S)-binding domain-containing protein n=1 Tax=Mycobacteroides abscessus TaxID=36809 RepID=UPI0009C47F57|nr:FAD-binding and (Fe-S)-binding domain-containing protein [Mycobacteroides abscessus]SKQ85757.1 D-lactate dehydrogenase [Mycobacteroides abscessus subsp. massiliense]